MTNKKIIATTLPIITGIAGLAMGLVFIVSAQTPNPTTTPSDSSAKSGMHRGGHAPLGGDGNVTAINGTTLAMQEEADEGGALYTVNASNAIVTKDGNSAQLSDIKVGDKVFVKGTVDGTTVTATSLSAGFHGGRGHRPDGSQ